MQAASRLIGLLGLLSLGTAALCAEPLAASTGGWTLLLTGDIIPARSVHAQMTRTGDFGRPLESLTEVLRSADLTLFSLESPLLTRCPVLLEGRIFCGDARFAKTLANAKTAVANLANNHALNYGWDGLAETEGHLLEAGIATTGFAARRNDDASSSGIEG